MTLHQTTPITEVIKSITVMDTMTASGKPNVQGTLERKTNTYLIFSQTALLSGKQQNMGNIQREYLGLSLRSCATSGPVEWGGVVELLGALTVVASKGLL